MQTQQGFISWLFAAILFISTSALGWFYYLENQSSQQQAAEISQLLTENNQQNRALRQAESSKDQLSLELQALQRRINETQQTTEAFESQQANLNNQMQRLQSQLQQSQQSEQEAKNQLTTVNAELATLKEQLDSTSETLQSQNEELANAQAEQERALTTIASLQNQLTEAATTEELYQTARQQLALQQAENETYSETIARLQQEMEAEANAMSALETQLQAQLSELNQENEKLITQFEDGTTAIKLPESILFASGSAKINEEGQKALLNLADALKSFPNHLISIQGHSDKRTMTKATSQIYPTNWELSSARAASAVRELISAGLPPEQMQAVGFASTRPLVEEIDATARQTNRRIEVILLPNQFKLKVLAP